MILRSFGRPKLCTRAWWESKEHRKSRDPWSKRKASHDVYSPRQGAATIVATPEFQSDPGIVSSAILLNPNVRHDVAEEIPNREDVIWSESNWSSCSGNTSMGSLARIFRKSFPH